MVHGYFNPLATRSNTTPGSLHPPSQRSPLSSPVLHGPVMAPLHLGQATQTNPLLGLLVTVAIVPLAQRFAPNLFTLSISNARIVATTEPVGEDVFPVGANEDDIAAHEVVKHIQEEFARQQREEAEAAAAAAAAAAATIDDSIEPDKEHTKLRHHLPQSTMPKTSSGSGIDCTSLQPFAANRGSGAGMVPSRSPVANSGTPITTTDGPANTGPKLPPRKLGGEGLPPASVQRLRFVDCVIDSDALRRLGELRLLEQAVFIGCAFPAATGIDGLESLATNCPRLHSLVLSSCDIHSVNAIAMIAQLRELDLSINPNLEDISPLQHLKNLETLNVNGCSVRSVACLGHCPFLWKLEVAGNPLGPAFGGSSHTAHAGASWSSTAVQHRALPPSPLLGPATSGNSSITAASLSASQPATASPCGGLELLTRLEYLDAEHCGLVNITPLTKLTELRYLSLARNRIRHDEYARLPPEFVFLSKLEELDLSKTNLLFLRHLDGLPNLRILWIEGNTLSHNALPQHVSVLPELLVLHAENCGLDDLRRLPEICPKLVQLYASKNKQLTDDRMPTSFSLMPNLAVVHLDNCSLTSARCFHGSSHIREVNLSENTLTRGGASDLSDTSASMEVLLIANCGIRDTTFLKDLIHVKRVDLRGNVLNAALPPYLLLLDSMHQQHLQKQQHSSRTATPAGTPGSLQHIYTRTNTPGGTGATSHTTPGSLSASRTAALTGGGGNGASAEDPMSRSFSNNALLRSPQLGPSAASPSRYRVKRAHADPLAW